MTWTTQYHPAAVDELSRFPADVRARVQRVIDMIEAGGPQNVGMPHVRFLGDKLWEIRASGKDSIGRAIYVVASGRRVVVVHAFVKKTQKTPPWALRTAQARWRDYDG